MKRFLNRFLHLLPDFAAMTMIYRTRYHQDQAIRQPLQEWLKAKHACLAAHTSRVSWRPPRRRIGCVLCSLPH